MLTLILYIRIFFSHFVPEDSGTWTEIKEYLNCFYSIFAKKHSHGHFTCIKKPKIIPKSCCLSAIMFLSSKNFLLISMILNLNCFYSISVKKRNSHCHFKCIKLYRNSSNRTVFGTRKNPS